ncbi:MAG: hypothetical protein NWF04_03715 [Candidatus Bathyarchaeota archaeon]|nr:hypothetical protein [Candidatus Bathyarchaeota archaeon]
MSESKKVRAEKSHSAVNKTVKFEGGVVSSTDIGNVRRDLTGIGVDAIVSGTNVKQTKNQIPKPKGSQ